uniref:RNase H type-1 domain-containing protein n=1 Tax=Brassica campestris TaxID=3711 RepID=M4DYN7_BRACM
MNTRQPPTPPPGILAIDCIGQDIGVYEEAEISTLTVRMRVQINGRLPLIKSSILELDNGEEVSATLVYEKLDKHCTYCHRLDHESRDCLKAKAEKREALALTNTNRTDKSQSASSPGRNLPIQQQRRSTSHSGTEKSEEIGNQRNARTGDYMDRNRSHDSHRQGPRGFKGGYGKNTDDRSSQRKRFHPYSHQREDLHAPARYHQSRNVIYREIQRTSQDQLRMPPPPSRYLSHEDNLEKTGQREESSASKAGHPHSARGTPLRKDYPEPPREAIAEAMGEIRDVMNQYTLCADPSESAARRERLRRAEEKGDFEEAAVQMARTSLATKTTTLAEDIVVDNAERIPALLRLGSPNLTPNPLEATINDSPQRTPVLQRLGPLVTAQAPDINQATQVITKRKPGRPPGKRTVQSSPKNTSDNSLRKRRVQATKPPPCRRRLPATLRLNSAEPKQQTKKTGDSQASGHRSVESHGWKGILIGRDLILQNAGWAVGDGESISVWADPWLSLSAPRRPMGPTPERFANLKVKDLMLPNGSDWNRDLIQQIMPQEEATILSIKASRSGTPDKLIWLGTTSGEYTTKSGYLKAMESSPTSPPPNRAIDWNKGVWQLEVAPKIKLFLWKIFQGALAIGDRLVTRNISTGTSCKTCNNVESINHLFLHCDIAYKVWKLAPFSSCIDSRRLLDLNTAWQGLSKLVCLPPTGISTGPLAPCILWSLWLARNNRLFNNKISTPEEIVSRATAAAQEWLKEQRTEPPNTKDTRVLGPPREMDSSRLQTDAAWRADLQCAGLGWTIIEKDQSTTHLSYCYFVSSPLVAEALAVRDALAHCRALGILRLRCQTDSQQLVKALATKDPNPEIYRIVSDTLVLASSFDSISFEWLPRAQNNVADALAKQALYNACPVTPQIDSEV